MKKIGLIGGISWISTLEYYKHINELVNQKLGGDNYAECLLYSFNYADIKKNNAAGDWEKTLQMISDACEHMKAGGAQAIVLCANTMHMVAEPLQQKLQLPVIHIAEATAAAINKAGITKVGLLGTIFTMEEDFFTRKLTDHQIEYLIPEAADRQFIHRTIGEELGNGIFTNDTRARYKEIIRQLVEKGCEGIILGCTEIPLLISQEDCPVPVFDTTLIHSKAAVDFMCS